MHHDSSAAQTQEECPISMTRPSRPRQPVQRFKTTHTPRPPRSQTPSEILWHTDPSHKKERLSWIGKEVSKFFPTHGTFKGKIQQYQYASDDYFGLWTTLSRTKTTTLNESRTSP
jgi:hypothetical protein